MQANRKPQQSDGGRASPASGAVALAAQQALNRLSPCGLALLHLYAALGYEWGVQVLAVCRCPVMIGVCPCFPAIKHMGCAQHMHDPESPPWRVTDVLS